MFFQLHETCMAIEDPTPMANTLPSGNVKWRKRKHLSVQRFARKSLNHTEMSRWIVWKSFMMIFWTMNLNLNFILKETVKHPMGAKVVQSQFMYVPLSPHWPPIMTAMALCHTYWHNLLFIQCIRKFRFVVIYVTCRYLYITWPSPFSP